jgi:hypothetical protein
MHSIQSLRDIRAMEFFLYGGLSKQEFYNQLRQFPRPVPDAREGEVLAVLRYDLATREISVSRTSPEGNLAAQAV